MGSGGGTGFQWEVVFDDPTKGSKHGRKVLKRKGCFKIGGTVLLLMSVRISEASRHMRLQTVSHSKDALQVCRSLPNHHLGNA